MSIRSAIILSFSATLALACQGAKQPASSLVLEPAEQPRAWTAAFLKEAVLVADEITIEGPHDLIDHIVLRQDEESTLYTTKTVPEGLWQELAAKPGMGEVRGQLDAWSLAAFRKITILQRPGDVPVTVRARGKAYWAASDGSGEQRQEQLVFQGVHGSQGLHGR